MATGKKMTMFFNFLGSGFSETWYNSDASTIADLSPDKYNALATARDNLAASTVNLVGYRVTDLANPRQTYTQNFPPVLGTSNVPDVISNAQLAIVHGANGVGRRQFWMRGTVDNWTEFDLPSQTWKVIPAFQGRYATFVNLLTNSANGWSIQTVQSRQAAGAAVQNVSGINSNAATGQAVLTVATPVAFNPGPLIVSGFKKPLARLNGTYLLGSGFILGATTITLVNRFVTAEQATAWAGTGWCRVRVPTMTQITQFQLDSPRSRRCGRAFFVPRGRRPARS